MLRSYREGDKESLEKLIKKTEGDTGGLREVITNSEEILLFDQNGLMGCSYYSIYNTDEEKIAQISLVVDPKHLRCGVGTELYKEMERHIAAHHPDFVCVYMNVDSENPVPFAEKMGFEKWWASPEWIYRGGPFPEANLKFVPYKDEYFNRFLKVVQDSYFDLHKKNDLKPYLATAEIVKEYKLNRKDNVYLVLDNENIVASVTTGKGEVDNLMVSPDYQGRGYGRKALQFGMNKLLEEGYEDIRICFVEGNEHAEQLYSSVGFQPLHSTQVYRKFL